VETRRLEEVRQVAKEKKLLMELRKRLRKEHEEGKGKEGKQVEGNEGERGEGAGEGERKGVGEGEGEEASMCISVHWSSYRACACNHNLAAVV
jgi:hypothetical protein